MSSGGPGDFQSTLNELERRLRELMSDLVSPSAERTGDAPAEDPPGPPPMPPYRPPTQPPPPPAPSGGLQDQLDELLRFRDQLTEAAKGLVEDYSRVLEQITRAVGEAPEPAAPPPPPTTAAGHVTFPVPPPASQPTESTLYSGNVSVDAGPFADIATVAAFEGALRRVPHAEDVVVRSFEAQRAVVELRLAAEVPLVFELRRASDQAFDVDLAGAGRLTLTMHSGNLPFPMRPANEREAPPVPPPNGGETD